MKILKEFPPNLEKLKKVFNLRTDTIYTFGDIIYNPFGFLIDKPLLAHEKVHSKQQKEYGIDKWWSRYIIDSAFRLSQEVEAYQTQYKEAKKIIKDKNQLSIYVAKLARDLSGGMYGNMIDSQQARKAIMENQLFKFKV